MIALAQQSNILDFPSAAPQGKSNEWYTPARYIEAARKVMGSIDLDPASSKLANFVVKAQTFYSKEDDGLSKLWFGNVWCNPPYGKIHNRSFIEAWTRRLILEYKAGNVKQGILLVQANPDTAWFQLLWEYLICFCDHHIMFHRPGSNNEAQVLGTVFTYLGSNEQKFIEVFSQFGTIAKRVSQPRHTIATPSLWEVQS